MTPHEAVQALLESEAEARRTAVNLRAVLAHATVELKMHQEWTCREERRAELFALYEAGRLRLTIGGGHCVAEIVPAA